MLDVMGDDIAYGARRDSAYDASFAGPEMYCF